MKVKITDVGSPFYHNGKTGFNVGVEFGDIQTSAFVSPSDDLNLALYKAVNEAIRDKNEEEAAERYSQYLKTLVGAEIELPEQ